MKCISVTFPLLTPEGHSVLWTYPATVGHDNPNTHIQNKYTKDSWEKRLPGVELWIVVLIPPLCGGRTLYNNVRFHVKFLSDLWWWCNILSSHRYTNTNCSFPKQTAWLSRLVGRSINIPQFSPQEAEIWYRGRVCVCVWEGVCLCSCHLAERGAW